MPSPQSLIRLTETARILKLTKQTGRSFHVAFILKGRKVISLGINNFHKTNRICHTYKPTRHHLADYRACAHSEVQSTAKFRHLPIREIRKLTLVSIRINNKNQLAFAQPCPNCAYHLGKWGYDDIWYSTNEGTFDRMPKPKYN